MRAPETRTHRCPACGSLTAPAPRTDADTRPIEVRALERIAAAIEGCPAGSWQFFVTLLDTHPKRRYVAAKDFARALDVHFSSLASRAYRLGLPSPKDYVRAALILRAVARYDGGKVSIARIADELGMSSPQSFGRSLRAYSGLTAGGFLRSRTAEQQLDAFMAEVVTPYIDTLRQWSPLAATPLTRATRSEVLSYGVRCTTCGEYETACICEPGEVAA